MSADSALSQSVSTFVRTNWRTIIQLPAPGRQWRKPDAPANVAKRLPSFHANGVISKHTSVREHNADYTIWTTNSQPYERAQRRSDNYDGGTLPCGHPLAFQHRNGNIHCKHPGCNGRWPVDDVRDRILGGED